MTYTASHAVMRLSRLRPSTIGIVTAVASAIKPRNNGMGEALLKTTGSAKPTTISAIATHSATFSFGLMISFVCMA